MDANWGVIGNERAVRALAAAVANGAAVQAYLFTGPEGTGRATAARRLAMALNCTGEEPPCGNCTPCHRVEAGIHADVQTIAIDSEAEGPARKSISVEQLNEDKLLETIHSRCTRIEFRLVPTGDIEAALLERDIDRDHATLLARLAGGRPGWALSAAREAAFLERRAEVLASARTLPTLPLADRFDLAERLSEAFKREREPVLRWLDDWAGWWRDVLLTQSGAAESIANLDESAAISAAARDYSRRDAARFVQAIIETRGYLGENVQSRVALDALMLNAPE